MRKCVWIGHDPREQDAFAVAATSLLDRASAPVDLMAVDLSKLRERGLYQRPTEVRGGKLWDVVSGAPMSTEFAISRFFVPLLSTQYCSEPWDWAVFMDCDVMLRADIDELFALADPTKAIQVVEHNYVPSEAVKMDGQTQTSYPRKNQSSVMLWNLRHPANAALTISKLNTWAGRSLHAFLWLSDDLIGGLPREWNHLVGVDPPNKDAKIAHFTLGVPSMNGYEQCEFSEEWNRYCRSLSMPSLIH